METCAECGAKVNIIWKDRMCEQCMRASGVDPEKEVPISTWVGGAFSNTRDLETLLKALWFTDAYALPVDAQAEAARPATGGPKPGRDRPEDPPLDDNANDGRRR